MSEIKYSNFEQKLIKNGNISFVKMLIEKDIKSYKYDIMNENILDYIQQDDNKYLYNIIKNCDVSDNELSEIQSMIIKTSSYNLEVEYLPTEEWEFDGNIYTDREFVITLPNYEMLSNALALFILIFPFSALFLSYFLIMVFR